MAILDRNSGVFNTTTTFNVTRSTGSFGTGTVIVIGVFGNTVVSTPAGASVRATNVSNLGLYVFEIAGAGQASITVTASPAGSGEWFVWELTSGSTFLTGNAGEAGGNAFMNLSITPTAGDRHILAAAGGINTGNARAVTGYSNSFSMFGAAQVAAQDWPFAAGANLDTTASGAAIATTATFNGATVVSGGVIVAYVNTGGGDVTAPTVPTGLTVGAVSATTANLSWTASTDDVAVTGYQIEIVGP